MSRVDKCYYVRLALISMAFVLLVATAAPADVKLPAVIGDNMVLQQETKTPIWGWAAPGETVSVRASWSGEGGTENSAAADNSGKWTIKIDTPKAGGPYTLTIKGKNQITLKNILVGEVWVGSGQSNMEWPVKLAANAQAEVAAANYPEIRLFMVAQKSVEQPQSDCQGKWVACSPRTIENFSAVLFFYGRELHKQLGAPVGLIETCWGGTPIEAWMNKKTLQSDPDFLPILQRHAESKEKTHYSSPMGLYNGMIAPIIPFGIRGVIWYHGEGNAYVGRSHQYRKLFPAMIANWRQDWGQGDFPFYYVQVTPVGGFPVADSVVELQEAQRMTLSVPNTGMAVIADIGDVNDLHPKNKQGVGQRLALWAMAKTYHRQGVVYSGPLYKSMKIEGERIRLLFDHVEGGLAAKNGTLKEFTIAGEDRKFSPATAVIDGDTVVVSAEGVKKPVAVRFAWSNTSVGNLFNQAGLPAPPFRTDDWPGTTFGKL